MPEEVRKRAPDRAGREHGPGPGRGADRRATAGRGVKAERDERQARRPTPAPCASRPREAPIAATGDGTPADQPPAASRLDRAAAAERRSLTDGVQGLLRESWAFPKTASQAEIKKAYRRLARELHPDTNKDRRRREALQGRERGARRPLRPREAEAVRRARRELAGLPAGRLRPGGATDWAGFGGAPGGTRWTYRTASAEDLGGFSDFFRAFFGGGERRPFGGPARLQAPGGFDVRRLRRPRAAAAPAARPRVPAAHATAEVTLAEVATGAERMVNVNGRRLQVKIPRRDRRARRSGSGSDQRPVRRRPRHQRQGQARPPLRAPWRRPRHRAAADPGRGAPRRRGSGPHADRHGEAPRPPQHPERPGDPAEGRGLPKRGSSGRRATSS